MTSLDWDKLVLGLGPRLKRYFGLEFAPPLAADLVQETFLRLVRQVQAGKLDPIRGTPTMLAFGIAHYVRLEARKAAVTRPIPTGNEETVPAADHEWESREREKALRSALSELKEVERQILLLHLDEEMTLTGIAAILGLPVGTIKSHVHRAKQTLRARLTSHKESL